MSFKTVPQMFQHVVSERPTLKTFYTKTENGWEGIDLAELQVMVEDFANGLKNLGINDNDKVAIKKSTNFVEVEGHSCSH